MSITAKFNSEGKLVIKADEEQESFFLREWIEKGGHLEVVLEEKRKIGFVRSETMKLQLEPNS